MSVILLLIPLSIAFAACFLGAFIWAARSGQFEDTCTPSMRVLLEEKKTAVKQPIDSSSSPKPLATFKDQDKAKSQQN